MNVNTNELCHGSQYEAENVFVEAIGWKQLSDVSKISGQVVQSVFIGD